MTREHLIEDIQNVIELVNRAEQDPGRREEVHNALRGLYRHIENEGDVPATVQGCLREAAESTQQEEDGGDAHVWRNARACLEAALDFLQGQ